MGWMVAAAAVFVILASLVTLSLCMAARDEDDDVKCYTKVVTGVANEI